MVVVLWQPLEYFAFFLDVHKAYDTVWCDELWDMSVKGRIWCVIKI